jgi:4-hydroxy-tetrahydrodipicolinate synthase
MKKIVGAIGVSVTPLLKGDKPNYDELRKQMEELCSSEIDGIFPCSSTGGYPRLSLEDKLKIMEETAKINAGRKILIAGACAVSLDEIKLYIDKAQELGYDACFTCPPYYYPLSQGEVLNYYKEICAYAGDMPVIAYNVPFFTTPIEIGTFKELVKIPNLIGMKDSSGNMKKIAHECDVARRIDPNFVIYSGTDDCLLSALIAGCKGSMTAFGAIFPGLIKGIYENFESGNIKKAQKIQYKMLPMLRLADTIMFPEGYKLVAKACGLNVGEISPLCDKKVVEDLYNQIQDEMENIF